MKVELGDIHEALARCIGFRQLASDEREQLASTAQLTEWSPGETLVRLGEQPDQAYVLIGGYFDARDGRGESLALLRSGDVVGEAHLLLPGPATADVVAITHGTALAVDAAAARAAMMESPAATLDLASLTVERTRRSRLRSLQRPQVVGVSGSDAHREGAQRLVAALREVGLEVIEAPSQPVDTLVVVGQPGNPTHATRRLQINGSRGALIDDAIHMRISRWQAEDLARLVRLVNGGARIAVFSGGGVRAAAHVGILAELRKAGIEFDASIGVSAGGIGALSVGFQIDADAMEQLGHEWASGLRLTRDFGPTGHGFFTGRSLTESCRAQIGDRRLEDAERPCILVAADVGARRQYLWTKGPAWLALRSSASIPGLFPPVRYDGRLLVDGGVIDNLPTTLPHRMFPEPEVFAMDVGTAAGVTADGFSEDGIASRRNVVAEIPQLLNLLGGMVTQPSASPNCAHLFRPDIAGISILGRGSLGDAIAAGRRCAKEWLSETATLDCKH